MQCRSVHFAFRLSISLLLAVVLFAGRAHADHEIKETWNKYQEACGLYQYAKLEQELMKRRHDRAVALYDNCIRLAITYDTPEHREDCSYERERRLRTLTDYQAAIASVKETKKTCEDVRAQYSAELTEYIATLVYLGPEGIAEQERPPQRNVRKPHEHAHTKLQSRSVRDRPKHSVDQTKAAQAIGIMILQGIRKGPRTPSRGPTQPGGSHCHHQSSTTQMHCGGG